MAIKTDFICVLDIKERNWGGGIQRGPLFDNTAGRERGRGLIQSTSESVGTYSRKYNFFFILHESKLHETGQLNPTTSVLCLNLQP